MLNQNERPTKGGLSAKLLPFWRERAKREILNRPAGHGAEIRLGHREFIAFVCLIAATLAFDLVCVWLLANAFGQPLYLSSDWVACCYPSLALM